MSSVASEVLSLNHKAPKEGYLLLWNVPCRPLRILMRHKNVLPVFLLNIGHEFVSIYTLVMVSVYVIATNLAFQ